MTLKSVESNYLALLQVSRALANWSDGEGEGRPIRTTPRYPIFTLGQTCDIIFKDVIKDVCNRPIFGLASDFQEIFCSHPIKIIFIN